MITKKQEDFVWGALLGGAIGAAAALLLTPVAGAEVRKQFRNGFNLSNGKKARGSSHHAETSVKSAEKKTKRVLRARPASKTSHAKKTAPKAVSD